MPAGIAAWIASDENRATRTRSVNCITVNAALLSTIGTTSRSTWR